MKRTSRLTAMAIVASALVSAHAAHSQALPRLSRQLAGKSLQCGAGSDLYFAPDMRTASIVDGAAGTFPIVESQTTIDPSRIRSDGARLFEVILTTRDGETRHRFERRKGISLRLGDGDAGDDCVLADGRAAYVRTRFDMVREGVCGNDPKPSCEKALAKACGPSPEADCVRRIAPDLR